MPYKDPAKHREFARNWARKNRDKQRIYQRSVRIRVLDMLGGVCVYCGCDNRDALEINHKDGGGAKEHRVKWRGSKRAYYHAILNGSRSTDDLELTCRVCNSHHYLVNVKNVPDRWTIFYHKDGTPAGI